jgi:hypothetical protein
MKPISKFLTFLLFTIAVTGLFSCEKSSVNNGKGTAEFSVALPDDGSKSAFSSDSGKVTYQLMVSIEDMEGIVIMSDSLIPLYIFGTGYVSENIKMKTGQYKLTKFMVINPAGEVVYASPVEGSELAYLVNDPLPILFPINAERVTRVIPEVLYVGQHTPGEFGYAGFGMQIIKPLHFWTACVLENPTGIIPTQYTTAKLTVHAPDGWHYSFRLEAAVNHFIIRGGYALYTFLIEKEGYAPQKYQFSQRELLATSATNPLLLKIGAGGELKLLVLQPGPEDGKDAMISNLEADKNFGDHKYFEATYLSEPFLTVMRSNRSLIWFNLNSLPKSAVIKKVILHLRFDLPVPFDPSVFPIITDPLSPVWCGAVLQRITEPWEEYKVTWNTQPKTDPTNQVYISPFIKNANFLDVDVTRLYVSTPTFPEGARTNGMFFRLWPTEKFPGFRFTSSDYPDATMRPKLSIYYTIN